jgi:hypothetical protein
MQREQYRCVTKAIALQASTTGTEHDRDLRYHLAIEDHLPAIADDQWCAQGSTLAALRDWLREDFNGDLIQEVANDTTKRIVASWSPRPSADPAPTTGGAVQSSRWGPCVIC